MCPMKAVQPELANRMAGKSMPQLILASVLTYCLLKEPIKCQHAKNTSTDSPKIIEFIQLSSRSTARWYIFLHGPVYSLKKSIKKIQFNSKLNNNGNIVQERL